MRAISPYTILTGRALGRRRSRLGFTALEMSAVATIIAILALILMPLLRKRIEESRITAAMADMKQIELAQMMIHADTGYYVRLFDLSHPSADPGDSQAVAQIKLPKATWNQPINQASLNAFRNNWNGPYAVPNRQRLLREVVEGLPQLFRGDAVAGLNPQEGPVLLLEEDGFDERGQGAVNRSRYPIDPWGNPYIFFGPGQIGEYGYPTPLTNETNFNTAVIYCLGPNGGPGQVTNYTSNHFFRETGALGTFDDLSREF